VSAAFDVTRAVERVTGGLLGDFFLTAVRRKQYPRPSRRACCSLVPIVTQKSEVGLSRARDEASFKKLDAIWLGPSAFFSKEIARVCGIVPTLRVCYASLSCDLRFAMPAKSGSDGLSIGGLRAR
jgi:hypothetical protein